MNFGPPTLCTAVLPPLQVCIRTSGSEAAAGTGGAVGLELHGSRNVAGPIVLDNPGGRYFGQVGVCAGGGGGRVAGCQRENEWLLGARGQEALRCAICAGRLLNGC